MKKTFTFLFLSLSTLTALFAQTLVSTSVMPRNAVLEGFTGVNCPNCPDGEIRAEQLYNAFPGRVVLISVHSGGYAVPYPGQPDFRTIFGDSIDLFAGVSAYPSGDMNRQVWPGAYNVPPYFPQNPPNNLAIRRPGWWDNAYPTTGCGANIILQGGNSPVNIGTATVWNPVTRELQVTVELYYTATETQPNKLNVELLENGVVGFQSTPTGADSNYVHNHILRNMITGLWGDPLLTTTQGTFVSRNYSYIVPLNFNIDSCDLSVFVTQNDNKTTHTGINIIAKNGTTVGLNNNNLSSTVPAIYPNPANKEINITGLGKNVSEIKIVNVIGKTVMQIIPAQSVVTQDISKLPSGVYFVTITAGNKNTIKRFVKE